MTPAQCKAARTLLAWSIRDLAEASGTAPGTIQKFEAGERLTHHLIVERLCATLMERGVEFLPSEEPEPRAHLRAIELSDGSTVRLKTEKG